MIDQLLPNEGRKILRRSGGCSCDVLAETNINRSTRPTLLYGRTRRFLPTLNPRLARETNVPPVPSPYLFHRYYPNYNIAQFAACFQRGKASSILA